MKAAPAVWAEGEPVFPLEVPGAAVSPGTNNCNFTKDPGLTVIEGLVFAVRVPAASLAVMVRVPAVLKVKLDKVAEPEPRETLPAVAPLSFAIVALLSELLMVTFGVALL